MLKVFICSTKKTAKTGQFSLDHFGFLCFKLNNLSILMQFDTNSIDTNSIDLAKTTKL